jgi:endonuclease I
MKQMGVIMLRIINRRVLAVALVLCIMLMPFSLEAKNTRTPEQLYKHILEQLNVVEQQNPRSQAEIFKIRASLNELYLHTTHGDLTDPVDANGNHIAVDLSRGVDLYDPCNGLNDERLKDALLKIIRNHNPVGYQAAQDYIFEDLDNNDGWVECIYTGKKLQTNSEPSANIMNVEHTWPQSLGATGIAKSDLHHLFASDSRANGIRGNNPFGYVSNPTWEEGGSKTDRRVFEVRKVSRGNTARAIFYFAVRYGKSIEASQEKALREWHKQDPVDAAEKRRNDRIHNIQNNRNPFIDRPDFVDMISDF